MFHVRGVVAVREVLAGVTAAGLLAVEGTDDRDLRQLQQEAQLDGFQELGVETLALVRDGDLGVALLQLVDLDEGLFELEASLPAIVSVNEKINEPRFPSFKGIMAAKKKEVQTLTLADIGIDPETVGVANAGTTVTGSTPKPPRTAGERVTDEGEGGNQIAQYLVSQKII